MIGRDGWAGLVVLGFCALLYWLTLGIKGNPLVPIGPEFFLAPVGPEIGE